MFSCDGQHLFTGGSAGDICALDAERSCTFGTEEKTSILWRLPDAGDSIHCLHQLPTSAPTGSLLVSGDENGAIRLWDVRLCSSAAEKQKRACVMSWQENTDYLSAMQHTADGTTLLASCADCTLSAIDLRKVADPQTKKESLRRSDDQEDELLSLQVLKNGKKVVCGTQQGVLAFWSFGTWGDVSDRFPGHPASIDAMLKVDEDTVVTGCSDGMIRLVQLQPDKLLGVLGEHEGYPVEKLQFNANRSWIGSVSHDKLIRLWDASLLLDDSDDGSEADSVSAPPDQKVGTSKAAAKDTKTSQDDWDNDSDSLEDDDSDSDSEEEQETLNQKRAKRLKTDNERFFADL